MPDVTPATRAEILSDLDAARHRFIANREESDVTEDYMGYELADTTLSECEAAIEKLTDRAQIVETLQRAYNQLPLMRDGPARPAVENMRSTLVDLWKRLDPEA